MKKLAQITFVLLIQFFACYLAKWERVETSAILFFVLLWQGLFFFLFYQIGKKSKEFSCYKFNKGVWYALMIIASLISPILNLVFFIGGVLIELRQVSGCISMSEWLKKQRNHDSSNAELFFDSRCNESPEINYNPESGYFVGYRVK
ncbi:TPA: hypothetical protein PAP86_003054 [Salmonella enterica]|nr:hypothetical protein [Salmonella enterica]